MKNYNEITNLYDLLDRIFSVERTPDNDSASKKKEEEVPFDDGDFCPFDGDCSECPYERQCAEDLFGDEDYEPDMWGIPDVKSVVFSDPATIVFWADGTKTVVKCMKGEKFERYAGFMAACMKKMFGSTSRAKAIMNEATVEQAQKSKCKKKEAEQLVMFAGDKLLPSMDKTIQEAVDEALDK